MTNLNEVKLSNLRTQIDDIDGELLRLLAKRADLVEEVGQVKKLAGIEGSFIRSAREANMIKTILAKGAGKFPKGALFSIWRSIIAASLQMEGGLKIVILRGKNFGMDKLVVEYFGSFTPYVICDTLPAMWRAADDHTVAVLGLADNWWENLAQGVKVFAKLHDEVFAMAKINPEKAGEDKTLLVSATEIPGANKIANNLYEVEGFFETHQAGKVIGNYS